MMDQQSHEQIFEELKLYVGSALRVARAGMHIDRETLAQKLGQDQQFVEAVEEEKLDISFLQFQQYCEALEDSVLIVLKVAKMLCELDGTSESEVLAELQNELKYRLWEMSQRREES